MEVVTLRRVCELVNVSRRNIQCYEKAGLMMPVSRNKYGHLLYDIDAVQRAEKIKFFQGLGFKLREVKDIIDAPTDILKSVLEKRVKELEQEKEQFNELIQEAYKFIDNL